MAPLPSRRHPLHPHHPPPPPPPAATSRVQPPVQPLSPPFSTHLLPCCTRVAEVPTLLRVRVMARMKVALPWKPPAPNVASSFTPVPSVYSVYVLPGCPLNSFHGPPAVRAGGGKQGQAGGEAEARTRVCGQVRGRQP